MFSAQTSSNLYDLLHFSSDGTVPVAFDTDVNAPALAEYCWNARPFENSCAYITVGTGVGVGLVINGSTVHGLLHPEAGHLVLQRYAGDEGFKGVDKLFGASIEVIHVGYLPYIYIYIISTPYRHLHCYRDLCRPPH